MRSRLAIFLLGVFLSFVFYGTPLGPDAWHAALLGFVVAHGFIKN